MDLVFFVSELKGEQFEGFVLGLSICSKKGYIFKRNKEELGRRNKMSLRNPCWPLSYCTVCLISTLKLSG